MNHRTVRILSALGFALGVSALLAGPARADEERHHEGHDEGRHDEGRHHEARDEGHREFRGEIGRFHEQDWNLWHSGHWEHAEHEGRRGWWWVAGGLWYLFPAPVYPYPNPYEPPAAFVPTPEFDPPPPPPRANSWYFCPPRNAYYPYVSSCPVPWQRVAPQR
jgi:hypothetical protein